MIVHIGKTPGTYQNFLEHKGEFSKEWLDLYVFGQVQTVPFLFPLINLLAGVIRFVFTVGFGGYFHSAHNFYLSIKSVCPHYPNTKTKQLFY